MPFSNHLQRIVVVVFVGEWHARIMRNMKYEAEICAVDFLLHIWRQKQIKMSKKKCGKYEKSFKKTESN